MKYSGCCKWLPLVIFYPVAPGKHRAPLCELYSPIRDEITLRESKSKLDISLSFKLNLYLSQSAQTVLLSATLPYFRNHFLSLHLRQKDTRNLGKEEATHELWCTPPTHIPENSWGCAFEMSKWSIAIFTAIFVLDRLPGWSPFSWRHTSLGDSFEWAILFPSASNKFQHQRKRTWNMNGCVEIPNSATGYWVKRSIQGSLMAELLKSCAVGDQLTEIRYKNTKIKKKYKHVWKK